MANSWKCAKVRGPENCCARTTRWNVASWTTVSAFGFGAPPQRRFEREHVRGVRHHFGIPQRAHDLVLVDGCNRVARAERREGRQPDEVTRLGQRAQQQFFCGTDVAHGNRPRRNEPIPLELLKQSRGCDVVHSGAHHVQQQRREIRAGERGERFDDVGRTGFPHDAAQRVIRSAHGMTVGGASPRCCAISA